MPDSLDPSLPRIFLSAGELACPERPSIITTVLGSCVSLCLWDRVRCAGGMNHYALPYPFTADEEPNARYGAWAIEGLYECLLEQGSRPAHLEAKLFGGAALIPAPQAQLDIGGRNVALGLSELRRLGVPLKARRTGGQHGLLLHFRTDTAEVLLRRAGG